MTFVARKDARSPGPNCRRWLPLLLILHLSLVSEHTPKSAHFRLKFYMEVQKSQFAQKLKYVVVVVIVVVVVVVVVAVVAITGIML